LGVEDCTRFVLLAEEKLCTLAKGVLPSGAQGTCCRVYTRKVKENLKHLAWGLDVGHKDRTRITLHCLRLLFSVVIFLIALISASNLFKV